MVQNLTREDGTTMNVSLIDKKNIHNNFLQVINQYEESGGSHDTRYDVTILVNGLPLVHVELKTPGRGSQRSLQPDQPLPSGSVSGLGAGCTSMCRSSSSPTAPTPSTIPTQPGTATSGSRTNLPETRSKKTSNSFEFYFLLGGRQQSNDPGSGGTSPRPFLPGIPC